jgi:hypothetical protein
MINTQNKIGLTVWNSDEQSYFLIPLANLNCYFSAVAEIFQNVSEIKATVYDYLSTYNPETELVLLGFEEGVVTVTKVNKQHLG